MNVDLCSLVNRQQACAINNGITINNVGFVIVPCGIAGQDGIGNFNVRIRLGLSDGKYTVRKMIIRVPNSSDQVYVLFYISVFKPDAIRLDHFCRSLGIRRDFNKDVRGITS